MTDEHLIPPVEPEAPEDLGKPEDVRKRRVGARQKELSFNEYLSQVMSTHAGRAFIFELLDRCKIGGNLFSTNALIMAHNVGEHNIGNRLLADIGVACPNRYYEMMQESKE